MDDLGRGGVGFVVEIAAEHHRGPTTDEAGLIAVTLAEARRPFTTLLAHTTATTEQILAWPAGDDATSTEPAPPTTADAKP